MRWTAIRMIRRLRVPVLIVLDSAAWICAIWLAAALRLEAWHTRPVLTHGEASGYIALYGVLIVAGTAAAIHVLLAWFLRLHQGRSKLGSFEELFVLASVVVVAGATASMLNAVVVDRFLPRTVPIIATALVIMFATWPRALWRVLVSEAKPDRYGDSTPVLLIGAGEGGRQLVDSMLRDPKQNWRPVGFLDDDRRKQHFRHRGVRVLGRINDLGKLSSACGANAVVVAIPSADSTLLNRVNDLAGEADLDVKVLPPVSDLLGGVHYREIRDIEPADLLGRHPVETDVESIAGYLTGKRVLVTGAGGSIGSELCRQIYQFGPDELLMLDRDESALHALMLSIYGSADLESDAVLLADIRDSERIRHMMNERRPQVVFHAAALKHVNILEKHPGEAVHTNVIGTLNVLEAASEVAVERFVNISTDKAADPINVLGYTKRIAEGLTAAFGEDAQGVYLSVRFGNVLGSRGSVLETFEAQVSRGGPITVTDPDVMRFFMTVNEAVQLVIQAAAIGRRGEALVLDMGDPVRIADVANRFAKAAQEPVEIIYTGLKPGEKLHEALFADSERDDRPVHPLVSHVGVPPVSRQHAMGLRGVGDAELFDLLRSLATSMTPSPRIDFDAR